MKATRGEHLAIVVLALVVAAISLAPSRAQEGMQGGVPSCEASSTAASRGKRLFRNGTTLDGRLIEGEIAEGAWLSGREAACANCHGHLGEGTEEGGVIAPAIDGDALFSRKDERRAAYSKETIERALRTGQSPDSRALSRVMPRFRLRDADMADLLAYLPCAGRDADPGVSAGEIRFGAVLPSTGPLAEAGADVRAAIEAFFWDINREGGIFRRRLSLVVEDDATEARGEHRAIERLIGAGVFALVGSAFTGSDDASALLRAEGIPLVGPMRGAAPGSRGFPADEWVFRLYPEPDLLARIAVEWVSRAAPTAANVRLVHARDIAGERWAEGARWEAARRGVAIEEETRFDLGHLDARALRETTERHPDIPILFSGSAADLVAAARAIEPSANVRLYAPGWILAELDSAKASSLGRVIFVHAGLWGEGARLANERFSSMLRHHGLAARNIAHVASAYISAQIAIEALKRAGARPSRASFVAALEGLRGFETGLSPPLSYSKNRRTGVMGARLVALSADLTSDWIDAAP